MPPDMLDLALQLFDQFTPSASAFVQSLGRTLTEPKPNVCFVPDQDNLSGEQVHDLLCELGLAIDLKTRVLFHQNTLFINGEAITIQDPACLAMLEQLALATELEPEMVENAMKNPEFQFLVTGFAKAGWLNTVYE
ncbi:MAG: hypothetical protein HC848_10015 [Limnobacter sp.]|nr:hypothetical protein [Limnobacter sp.]